MKINGKPYRTIWLNEDGWSVSIIDQTKLPFAFEIVALKSVKDAAHAIKTMQVRGAPLIGATAAYGLALAMREDATEDWLVDASEILASTRPTAINLRWALEEMKRAVADKPADERAEAAYARAAEICNEDVETCRRIGEHGLGVIEAHAAHKKGEPVNILTHCNAGWLATVDWGTALAPIYMAHDAGIPVHVWVDETRPRNQGASLTAFELGAHGVPHTLIADNAGGHLMQQGQVDLCIVGTDRTTVGGDVANKIGTYLKALAAKDNDVPFFVALPSSTIDWTLTDGRDIPIEERGGDEVKFITGKLPDGSVATVEITPEGTPAANYAFDVTPRKMVTGFITERGGTPATPDGLRVLYPEHAKRQAA
ncbi:S-methyl-5-thioribose-1-phosphate isomerase [Methyloligella sp. 2.7D]|uniref:S-methyl-5-thioribose-1-phosphate isomerase n=1 Tax=unclassified Methyloligella TaxID=2625955 RepID=UPI00157D4CCA|nr:S-methyl-5-thioribose-1-phosphate isomerase [Methyloligella sp. GL2]QKP77021.1 S-methyl-5-thioribose-1-phosphate isomerase [Methyloligella sp. GL2]